MFYMFDIYNSTISWSEREPIEFGFVGNAIR